MKPLAETLHALGRDARTPLAPLSTHASDLMEVFLPVIVAPHAKEVCASIQERE